MTRIYCEGFLGKILGHKYIVIYNEVQKSRLPDQASFDHVTPQLINASKTKEYSKTYIKSICKRCGDEIK